MLTAKEAKEKARETQRRREEEKTKKCEKHYRSLVQRIEQLANDGDFETRVDTDKLSSEHLGRLQTAGYSVKHIGGPWYEISWRFANLMD